MKANHWIIKKKLTKAALLELAWYAACYDEKVIEELIDILAHNRGIIQTCLTRLRDGTYGAVDGLSNKSLPIERLMLLAILHSNINKERARDILLFVKGTLKQIIQKNMDLTHLSFTTACKKECERLLNYDPSLIVSMLSNILAKEAETPDDTKAILKELRKNFSFVAVNKDVEQWVTIIKNLAQILNSPDAADDSLAKLQLIDEQLIKAINHWGYSEDLLAIDSTDMRESTRMIAMRFFIYALKEMLTIEAPSFGISQLFRSFESKHQNRIHRINAAIKMFIKLIEPHPDYPDDTSIRVAVFPEEKQALDGFFMSGELVDLFKSLAYVKLIEVSRPDSSDSSLSIRGFMALFRPAAGPDDATAALTSTLIREPVTDAPCDRGF